MDTPTDTQTTSPSRMRKQRFAVASPGADLRQRRKAAVRGVHIKDEVFRDVLEKFEFQLNAIEDKEAEAFGLVIRGVSGVGKSHTMKHLIECGDPRLAAYSDEFGDVRPVVYVRAPAPCDLTTLGIELYFKLTGKRLSPRGRPAEIWSRVRPALYNTGVCVIFIDEMHHVFLGKTHDQRENLMSTLKGLLQGVDDEELAALLGPLPPTVDPYPIGLVMAGLPSLKRLIALDDQLRMRCRFKAFAPLRTTARDQAKLKAFIEFYAKGIGFTPVPKWTDPDMLLRLTKASGGYRGRIALLIKQAAMLAINRGLTSIEDWKPLFAECFEDIWETGSAKNPFLVPDVTKIGPIRELQKDFDTLLRGKGAANLVNDEDFDV
ncbi:hypothetical protein MSC49_29990 [Methylosinus sp. C49]|uniref:TniB family NTP-binding protein n=1 Tax=Methylosinus sp. C49 TaxID=2699395 RepID=UPI001366A170|nr:TniB family NTP-binding protein [Methylosinus sp. C49]BBU63064.1 hypothetical protein MSC49_29990 [Methylosinus sp. C49]